MNEIYQRGRCSDGGHHRLFFSERLDELAAAQQICAACDVRTACLALALDEGLEYGVWGGVIFWEGRSYHRRRGRGRPRRAEGDLPVEADRGELAALVRPA